MSTKKSTKKTITLELDDQTIHAGSTIQVPPLLDLPIGYLPRTVKVHLNLPQRVILKRLTETLQSEATQLEDGKYVDRPVDAIRWLLEQLAAVA